MERNNLYPIFLKLDNLHVLIVGGGNVAEGIMVSGVIAADSAATIVRDQQVDYVVVGDINPVVE